MYIRSILLITGGQHVHLCESIKICVVWKCEWFVMNMNRESNGEEEGGVEKYRAINLSCAPCGLGYLSCFWHQQSRAFWVVINQSPSDKLAQLNGLCKCKYRGVGVREYSSVQERVRVEGGTLAKLKMSRSRYDEVWRVRENKQVRPECEKKAKKKKATKSHEWN